MNVPRLRTGSVLVAVLLASALVGALSAPLLELTVGSTRAAAWSDRMLAAHALAHAALERYGGEEWTELAPRLVADRVTLSPAEVAELGADAGACTVVVTVRADAGPGLAALEVEVRAGGRSVRAGALVPLGPEQALAASGAR